MILWQKLTIAILGGDGRETEMASLATDAGASVRLFGAPPSNRRDVTTTASLAEALDGARIAILPVPYPGADGALYAPFAEAPIHITADDLSAMAADALVITGKSDAFLDTVAEEAHVIVREYENDTDLMLLRAPAIAEGAIRVAIEHSPVTVHGTQIGLVGFGRIGSVLTRSLIALNANVHVFARRAEARAAAYALGAKPHLFDAVPQVFPELEILYNTAPAAVVDAAALAHLRRGSLVVDLAAPPGGIDLAAAREYGLSTIWARGLGASAPRTVARSQWIGVERIARSIVTGQSLDQAT
jgi:dipicolinate synthase subunit A